MGNPVVQLSCETKQTGKPTGNISTGGSKDTTEHRSPLRINPVVHTITLMNTRKKN